MKALGFVVSLDFLAVTWISVGLPLPCCVHMYSTYIIYYYGDIMSKRYILGICECVWGEDGREEEREKVANKVP